MAEAEPPSDAAGGLADGGRRTGGGGTLWARRRVERLAQRVRTGDVVGDIAAVAESGARAAARRVQGAVDAGRVEARWRENELRRTLVGGEEKGAAPGAR